MLACCHVHNILGSYLIITLRWISIRGLKERRVMSYDLRFLCMKTRTENLSISPATRQTQTKEAWPNQIVLTHDRHVSVTFTLSVSASLCGLYPLVDSRLSIIYPRNSLSILRLPTTLAFSLFFLYFVSCKYVFDTPFVGSCRDPNFRLRVSNRRRAAMIQSPVRPIENHYQC